MAKPSTFSSRIPLSPGTWKKKIVFLPFLLFLHVFSSIYQTSAFFLGRFFFIFISFFYKIKICFLIFHFEEQYSSCFLCQTVTTASMTSMFTVSLADFQELENASFFLAQRISDIVFIIPIKPTFKKKKTNVNFGFHNFFCTVY